MADFKDIQIDDVLIDKYGNEFRVKQFIGNENEYRILVEQVKYAPNSPIIYVPAYQFGSDKFELKEFSKEGAYNIFGMLIIPESKVTIFGHLGNPEDNLKYVPCYSEMEVKQAQGILDVLDDLIGRVSLSEAEQDRFLNRIERLKNAMGIVIDEESLASYLRRKIIEMR